MWVKQSRDIMFGRSLVFSIGLQCILKLNFVEYFLMLINKKGCRKFIIYEYFIGETHLQ